MKRLTHRSVTRLVTVAGLFLLVGCGGPTTGTQATPPAATTPPGITTSPTVGAPVRAELDDFTITLSPSTLRPGTYTFVAQQQGQLPHALAIKGPGVDAVTPVIQLGGASQQLTVTLQPGTYELWCPVGNHRAQGMTVTVP